MLRELRIENIAVIERAELTFQPGLSVLSGETGAGKSIIIDALNAILGGRVSRELIRTGQSRAVVTAVFDALSPVTRNCARELGLEVGEELILRREMDADGRNLCRVCGQPATLAMLRTLGQNLVSIYGQHDGQHLLNEQLHIDYLDAFGGTEAAIAPSPSVRRKRKSAGPSCRPSSRSSAGPTSSRGSRRSFWLCAAASRAGKRSPPVWTRPPGPWMGKKGRGH